MLLRMTGEAAPQPLRFTLLLFWKPEPVEIVPQGRARDLGQGEVWERTRFPKELWGGGISSRNTGKFMWGAHCWELWAGSYLQTNSRKGRKGKERKTFITAGESADRGWKLQREERQSAAPKRPRAQSTSGHMQASTYVKRWWEFNIFKHLFLVAREHPTVHIFFFFLCGLPFVMLARPCRSSVCETCAGFAVCSHDIDSQPCHFPAVWLQQGAWPLWACVQFHKIIAMSVVSKNTPWPENR